MLLHKEEGVRLKLKRDFPLSHLSPQIIMDQQTTIMIASHAGCLLLLKQYMVDSSPGSIHSPPFGMEESGCLVPRLHPLFSLRNGREWLEPGDEAKYMVNSMFHLHAVLKDEQYSTYCCPLCSYIRHTKLYLNELNFHWQSIEWVSQHRTGGYCISGGHG